MDIPDLINLRIEGLTAVLEFFYNRFSVIGIWHELALRLFHDCNVNAIEKIRETENRPLSLLKKAAKAELHTEGIRNTRKPYMDATMILHVDTSKKTDMTEKINEEIRSTLDSARTYHE